MLIIQLLLATALGVAGDPIDARYAPFLQDGCIDGPPAAALGSDEAVPTEQPPQLADIPMSGNSLRFLIVPDGYRGEGLLMVQIDSGQRRSMSADGKPFVLATVSSWERTCTVRRSLDDCPEAAEVLEQLKQLQIPVGYGMKKLDRIALHATSYSLQFHGYGTNRLSYSMPGNPLQEPLEQAKNALQACWQPAFDAAMAR